MRSRLALALRRFLTASWVNLIVLSQHPIKGRFRRQVAPLIQLIGNDKRRWATSVFWLVAERYHGLALLVREFIEQCRSGHHRPLVRLDGGVRRPALIRCA